MNFKLLTMAFFLCISSHVQAELSARCSPVDMYFNLPELIVGSTVPVSSPTYNDNTPVTGLDCNNQKTAISSDIKIDSSFANGAFSLRKEDIDIKGSTVTDADQIDRARDWLVQNLVYSPFVMRDSESGSNNVELGSSTTSANILPMNAAHPDNTTTIEGNTLYTGPDKNGIDKASFIINQLSFSINTQLPPADIAKVLNRATLQIKIGTVNFVYINESEEWLGAQAPLSVRLPISTLKTTCTLDVPSELDLGLATKDELNKNASANKKSFGIDISCDMPTDVGKKFTMTVQDMANVATTNKTGVLTNSASNQEKSNAVIQLIDDITGEPFQIGQKVDYFSVDESSTSFKKTASAQIYNPTPPATAGKVEGKASFLIDYE